MHGNRGFLLLFFFFLYRTITLPHTPLSLFEDTLYWTDRQLNRVLSAHKYRGTNQTVVSHLISQPLSIHVHHPSLQPRYANPCDPLANGTTGRHCQHLCLLSPSAPAGYACKCRPGYRLVEEERCVEEENAFIVLMKGNQIVDVPFNGGDVRSSALLPVVGIDGGLGLDYDRQGEQLYWIQGRAGSTDESDDENCTIYTTPYGGGGNRTEFLGGADGLVGAAYTLAFDWIGRNLYIGNRIASNIETISVDGKQRYRAIILSNDGNRTSVAKPRQLALDPAAGRLFWLDDGGFGVLTKLAAAGMDGSEPTILDDTIQYVESVTVDAERRTVYYSTQFPPAVHAIGYDGTGRRTVLSEENAIARPRGLAVHESRLYFIDPTYEKLVRVDLPNGDNARTILDNEPDLRGMVIFRKRSVTPQHPCTMNNGGCEHLCVPAVNGARVCLCGMGYKKENEVACTPYKTFAVVSQLDVTRGYSLRDSAEAMVPIAGPGHHILHVDVLYRESWIYWVEYNRGHWNGIFRVRPNGTELQHIVRDGIGSNGIRGLAIDWVAGNLYFTNVFPHENYVEVAWLDGTHRKVLVRTTNDAPRELAVNPIKRLLYWIDYGQFPRIGKCHLDGGNWTPVVTSGISNPRDLTVDMLTHDVYWVDSKLDMIQKVSYSGGNRQVIRRNLANPMAIAVFLSDVYWVDRNLASVFRASKFPGNATLPERLRTNLPKLRDITIYDINQQPMDDANPCLRLGNGGCDQLCFALPPDVGQKPSFRCDCAVGRLSTDGRHCETTDEYVIFATRTEIRSIELDPTSTNVPFAPVVNLTNVVGLDFDYADNKLFFTQIRPWSKIAYLRGDKPDAAGAGGRHLGRVRVGGYFVRLAAVEVLLDGRLCRLYLRDEHGRYGAGDDRARRATAGDRARSVQRDAVLHRLGPVRDVGQNFPHHNGRLAEASDRRSGSVATERSGDRLRRPDAVLDRCGPGEDRAGAAGWARPRGTDLGHHLPLCHHRLPELHLLDGSAAEGGVPGGEAHRGERDRDGEAAGGFTA
uniref:Putative low-density lipoprotein receptor n=1 Tax=Anopheles darlingi TaxID=43151 RepID=A0A2M4DP70_ANODA